MNYVGLLVQEPTFKEQAMVSILYRPFPLFNHGTVTTGSFKNKTKQNKRSCHTLFVIVYMSEPKGFRMLESRPSSRSRQSSLIGVPCTTDVEDRSLITG